MIEYFWKPQWVEAPELDPSQTEWLLEGGLVVADIKLEHGDLFRLGEEVIVCTFSGPGGCWLRKMTANETSYLLNKEGKN